MYVSIPPAALVLCTLLPSQTLRPPLAPPLCQTCPSFDGFVWLSSDAVFGLVSMLRLYATCLRRGSSDVRLRAFPPVACERAHASLLLQTPSWGLTLRINTTSRSGGRGFCLAGWLILTPAKLQ